MSQIDRLRDATQMQLRRGRRAIALLLASCIVLSGLVLLRHQTAVAHVHGAQSGELEHAHALADYHELSTTPHLHGRDVDAHEETGVCALIAALDHASIIPGSPGDATAAKPVAVTVLAAFTLDPPALALYRLAPKTSPPALT
jgi:hypothetical protein